MKINFTDILYNESKKERALYDFNKKIIVLVSIVFLCIVLVGCAKKSEVINEKIDNNENMVQELEKDEINVGNDGLNAAIARDNDVSIISDQSQNNQRMVSMSIEDTGRNDPFMPGDAAVLASQSRSNSDLLPPPESITTDVNAAEVITTKVSGIMYDRYNPSAILNIAGADYLVRTGDIINSYKVLSIAKDFVTVQLGANVYKAGVGQIFNGDGINFNTVSNLESKFGGNKKR